MRRLQFNPLAFVGAIFSAGVSVLLVYGCTLLFDGSYSALEIVGLGLMSAALLIATLSATLCLLYVTFLKEGIDF